MQTMTLAVTVSIVLASSALHGQPAPMDPAESAYLEGRRYYDLHDWSAAIVKFKEAYRLRSDAASLFDIAQAYRLAGDCVQAHSFYKTYRRNFPAAPNIARVDRFIADLDACARTSVPRPELIPPPLAPPVASVSLPPVLVRSVAPAIVNERRVADDPAAGRSQRIAGLVLTGAGIAAAGVGVIFGLDARAKANVAESGRGTWNGSLEHDGASAETAAESLWAIGGAAIVVGGVIYLLGRHDAPRVAVEPQGRGAKLVWSCAW